MKGILCQIALLSRLALRGENMEIGENEKTTSQAKLSLSYSWLYRKVQDYRAGSSSPGPSKWEKRGLGVGLVMAGLGLLVASLSSWIPAHVAVPAVVICLVGELVGLGLSVVLMVKRDLPQFTRPREQHAAELDADFEKWQSLSALLAEYPIEHRQQRVHFLRALHAGMSERMGLLYGGVQRLGLLPLLVALYLQFRDWEWGDWSGAFDVNLVGGLLIWAMLLLYSGGWLLMSLRLRLEAYISLLDYSLQDYAAASITADNR